jgi:hypothetical protein
MIKADHIHTCIVPNDILLGEIRKLVAEGHPVKFRVRGYSMLPFIVGDRDSVRLVKTNVYQPKDIVLAEIQPGHYVLHRIVSIAGNQPEDSVILMGDANMKEQEHCYINNLAGRVDRIFRNCNEIDPYSSTERIAVYCWQLLMPLRRWLIGVYRCAYLRYQNKICRNKKI